MEAEIARRLRQSLGGRDVYRGGCTPTESGSAVCALLPVSTRAVCAGGRGCGGRIRHQAPAREESAQRFVGPLAAFARATSLPPCMPPGLSVLRPVGAPEDCLTAQPPSLQHRGHQQRSPMTHLAIGAHTGPFGRTESRSVSPTTRPATRELGDEQRLQNMAVLGGRHPKPHAKFDPRLPTRTRSRSASPTRGVRVDPIASRTSSKVSGRLRPLQRNSLQLKHSDLNPGPFPQSKPTTRWQGASMEHGTGARSIGTVGQEDALAMPVAPVPVFLTPARLPAMHVRPLGIEACMHRPRKHGCITHTADAYQRSTAISNAPKFDASQRRTHLPGNESVGPAKEVGFARCRFDASRARQVMDGEIARRHAEVMEAYMKLERGIKLTWPEIVTALRGDVKPRVQRTSTSRPDLLENRTMQRKRNLAPGGFFQWVFRPKADMTSQTSSGHPGHTTEVVSNIKAEVCQQKRIPVIRIGEDVRLIEKVLRSPMFQLERYEKRKLLMTGFVARGGRLFDAHHGAFPRKRGNSADAERTRKISFLESAVLWEYDFRLADNPAKKIDEVRELESASWLQKITNHALKKGRLAHLDLEAWHYPYACVYGHRIGAWSGDDARAVEEVRKREQIGGRKRHYIRPNGRPNGAKPETCELLTDPQCSKQEVHAQAVSNHASDLSPEQLLAASCGLISYSQTVSTINDSVDAIVDANIHNPIHEPWEKISLKEVQDCDQQCQLEVTQESPRAKAEKTFPERDCVLRREEEQESTAAEETRAHRQEKLRLSEEKEAQQKVIEQERKQEEVETDMPTCTTSQTEQKTERTLPSEQAVAGVQASSQSTACPPNLCLDNTETQDKLMSPRRPVPSSNEVSSPTQPTGFKKAAFLARMVNRLKGVIDEIQIDLHTANRLCSGAMDALNSPMTRNARLRHQPQQQGNETGRDSQQDVFVRVQSVPDSVPREEGHEREEQSLWQTSPQRASSAADAHTPYMRRLGSILPRIDSRSPLASPVRKKLQLDSSFLDCLLEPVAQIAGSPLAVEKYVPGFGRQWVKVRRANVVSNFGAATRRHNLHLMSAGLALGGGMPSGASSLQVPSAALTKVDSDLQ